MKKALLKRSFDLEALEPRLLLSGDGFNSGLGALSSADSDILLAETTSTAGIETTAVAAYDPASHLDDIFTGMDSSAKSGEHPQDAGDTTATEPDSELRQDDSSTDAHESAPAARSLDGQTVCVLEPFHSPPNLPRDINSLTAQLTETLRAANAPPATLDHLAPAGQPAGDPLASPPGVITTETSFSASADTVTRIDIGGRGGPGVSPNGHDFFNLTGNISFAGTLQIVLINGFGTSPGHLSAGDSFTIFEWTGTRTGEFENYLGTATINILGVDDLAFRPVYDDAAKELRLQVISTHTVIGVVETNLENAIGTLQQVSDDLDSFGEFIETLPLIGGGIGNFLDVGQAVADAIRNPLQAVLDGLTRQAEITKAIDGLNGTTTPGNFQIKVTSVLGHYGAAAGDSFSYDVRLEITQLNLNQVLTDLASAVLGAAFNPDPTVTVRGTLEFDFSFGWDAASGFNGVYFDIHDLTARVTVEAAGNGGFAINFLDPIPGGPLSSAITAWAIDFEAHVTAAPDPSILTGTRIYLTDLAAITNVADAFNLTEGGMIDASVTLTTELDTPILNFTGDETLRIDDGNVFDEVDPDVTIVIDGSLAFLTPSLADVSLAGVFTLRKTATETIIEAEQVEGVLAAAGGAVQILRFNDGSGTFLLLDGDLAGSATVSIDQGPALPGISIDGTTLTLTLNTSNAPVASVNGEPVNLPAGPYFRVAGHAIIDLALPGAVINASLEGDFVFEPYDPPVPAGDTDAVVTVAVSNLLFDFTVLGSDLLQVSDGVGAFVFKNDGLVGTATADASLAVPGLDLNGAFTVTLNTTNAPYAGAVEVNGSMVTINVPVGPYLRVSGNDVELEILGFALTGDFTFERRKTADNDEVITIAFEDVEVPLASLTADLVQITDIDGEFILTNDGIAGRADADVFLGVPGVSVSGDFEFRINETGNSVNEMVVVGGSNKTISVPAGPYLQVAGDDATLNFLGLSIQGDFVFEQRTALSGQRFATVMASDVHFDFGTDILSLDMNPTQSAFFLITDSGMAGQGAIDIHINAFGMAFTQPFTWDFNNTGAPISEMFPGGPSLSPASVVGGEQAGGLMAASMSNPFGNFDLPAGPYNRFSTGGPIGFSVPVAGQNQSINAALVLTLVDGGMGPDYVTVGVSQFSATLGGAGVNLQTSGGTGAFVLFQGGKIAGEVTVESAALRVGNVAHSFIDFSAEDLRFEFNNTLLDVGPITVSVSDDPAEDVTVQFTGAHFRNYLAVAGTAHLNVAGFADLTGDFLFQLSGSGASQVLHVAASDLELDLKAGSTSVLSFHEGAGAFVVNAGGVAGHATLDFDVGVIGIMGTITVDLNTSSSDVVATVNLPGGGTQSLSFTGAAEHEFLTVCVDDGHIGIGALSFAFDFTVNVDTATGDLVLETKTGNPLLSIDGTTGAITIDPLSGIDLSNGFDQIGPADFVQMLRALANWLEAFRNSDVFNVEIPFTDGYTLGDALNWAQAFLDHVFSFMISVELQSPRDPAQIIASNGSLTLNNAGFDLKVGTTTFTGISVTGTVTALDNPGNPLDPTTLVGLFNSKFQTISVGSLVLGNLVEARINRARAGAPRFALALKQPQVAAGVSLELHNPNAELTAKLGYPTNDGDADTAEQIGLETERYTVEEFVVELGELLTGIPGSYDPNAKQFTFPVNIGWDQDTNMAGVQPLTLTLPFGFDADLGPIAGAELQGELSLEINASLSFTMGFDLNSAEVPRVVSTTFIPAPVSGQISADAHFDILLNQNPDSPTATWLALTLPRSVTLNNSSLDHLAADFNALFANPANTLQGIRLNQLLYAQKAGNGIAISVLHEDHDGDGQLGTNAEDTNGNGLLDAGEDDDGDGVLDRVEDLNGDMNLDSNLGLYNLLAIRSRANDVFATELGFGVEAYDNGGTPYFRTVSKSRVKGLFVENATFGGSIMVDTTQDITGSLVLGFLRIDLESPGNVVGTFDPYVGPNGSFDPANKVAAPITLSVDLVDEGSGSSRFYLHELLNGIEDANLANFISGPNLTGSFYAGITNISAGIGPVDLPTGAEISLWVPDITKLDYNPNPYDPTTNDEGIFLTYPELGPFGNFNKISFTQIIQGLAAVTDSLSELSAFSFLDERLPFIDVSINDLVDYAKKFADLVEAVGSGRAGSIQDAIADLEDGIEELFGLDPEDEDVFKITLDDGDGNDNVIAAPPVTVEGGDGRATATYNPTGDNNGLIFKSTSTNNSFNGVTIRFQGSHEITNDSALAEWDADTKTLTITLNGGVTTANSIIAALALIPGTPWQAQLVADDQAVGTGNTGQGTYSLSALKFSLNFTTAYANSLPFQLDLNKLVQQLAGQNGAAAAFLDAVTTFIQVQGSGVLTVSASAALTLEFGLDLTNPCEVHPFLYDTTGVELLAKVLGTNIEFSATLGAVAGIKVSEGTVTLDRDGNPQTNAGTGDRGANFRLGLRDNNGDGRHYFTEDWFNSSNIDLHMEGGVSAVLPIFIVVGPSELPLGSDADTNGDGYPDNQLVIDIPDLVRFFVDEIADNHVATLRIPGGNNDLTITGNASTPDNFTVILQQNGGLGSGASATIAGSTLTIQINSGQTTANAIKSHFMGNPALAAYTVAFLSPDNANGGNTGNGTVTTSKLTLITPDLSSLFEGLDLCDFINQNAGLLLDGLDALLGSIQDGLEEVAYSIRLPLIGDGFAGAANFIEDFREGLLADLRTEIASAGSATAAIENAIKKAFWNTLGPGGLDILVDPDTGDPLDPALGFQQLDVTLDCEEGLVVNLRLAREAALIDTSENPIDFDIGVPGFGLAVNGNVSLAVGFDLKFGFGFSKEDGFFFNSSAPTSDPELIVYLRATIPGLTATGELFFLQLQVSDDPDEPSKFEGSFVVDLRDPNGDGKLTFAEMTSSGTQFGDIISANLGAVADINLDLVASFGGNTAFPRVLAEFHLDWMFDLEDGAGDPHIEISDIYLDLGTFLSDFLGPILREIQKVTAPFQPIIDVVTARLPVLSDLAGETITLLTLAEVFGLLEPSTVDFIEGVLEVVSLINDLEGLGEGSILIPFGAFRLGDDGSGNMTNIQALQQTAALTGQALEDAIMNAGGPGVSETHKTQTAGFMGDVGSLDNFSIPIFDNPAELFNIFIGQPVRLIEWRMPQFKFEFTYTQQIPIYPPLYAQFGGKIGAIIDIGFGYDTFGIQKFIESEDKNFLDILDGFYVIDFDAAGNERNELTLYGELFAGASIDLVIVEAGVRGGLGFEVGFDLNDINDDGRVRVSEIIALAEIDPRCIFNINGRIYLFLEAFLIVDLFFFSIDKTWRFAEITLFEFEITCPEPVLAVQNGGNLTLNIGSRAADRQEIDTNDGAETFIVKHVGGTAGNETVEVQWGNYKKEFTGVSKVIVEDAGKGDDYLDFRGVLAQLDVNGGDGNDTIYLGDGANSTVSGGAGNDTIIAAAGVNNVLHGDAGNDLLTAGPVAIEIHGGEGNDTITGSPESDNPAGFGGLYGDGGNDAIEAGAGDDYAEGGEGNDTINGATGNDHLLGGTGNDAIRGDRDDDYILGGDGEDEILGGSGNDLLAGGNGDDLINGHSGLDVLIGDNFGSVRVNNTTVTQANISSLLPQIEQQGVTVLGISGDGDGNPANDGDDLLIGGGYIDMLFGGEGNDFLYGGNYLNNGETEVIEEDWNDFFDGGPGHDVIFGDDAMGRTGDRNTGIAIKSSIFFDLDNDGVRDEDETGFGGVTVKLFLIGDLVNPVATEMTESDGAFEFLGLDPGSYVLEFSLPTGLSFTTRYAPLTMGGPMADDPDDFDHDSDVDPATKRTEAFLVDFDQTETAVAAGYTGPARVSITDVSVLEGNIGQTALTFTITLSGPQTSRVEIDYETLDLPGVFGASESNGDYVGIAGTLVFAPGELVKTLTVMVNGDLTYEEHQQFELRITRAQRMDASPDNLEVSDAQILGTIINDDDLPLISIADYLPPSTLTGTGERIYLVGEGADARFVISLSNPSQYAITVHWRSDTAYRSNGLPAAEAASPNGLPGVIPDFQLIADAVLTFQPGEVRKEILVPLYDEADHGFAPLDEPDEHFYVDLFNPTRALIADSRAVGLSPDDDAPVSVSIAPAGAPPMVFTTSVVEGDTNSVFVTLNVTLSARSGKTVTVTFASAPGTAVEQVFSGDTDGDGDLDVIVLDTPDYISLPDQSLPEAEWDLVFAPGEVMKTIVVEVLPDNRIEGLEEFFVNLLSADNADIAPHTPAESNHVVIQIQDNDTIPNVDHGPWSVGFTDSIYRVDEPASGWIDVPITLFRTPGSSHPIAVFYTQGGTATAGADYAAVFRQLVIFEGNETEKTVYIRVFADNLAEGQETVRLWLRNPTGGPVNAAPDKAVLIIRDVDDVPILDVEAPFVLSANPTPPPVFAINREGTGGGNAVWDFTVRLEDAMGNLTTATYNIAFQYEFVSLTARNGIDFVGVASMGIITAGSSSTTVSVGIVRDALPELSENFALRITQVTGARVTDETAAAIATINDDDGVEIFGTVFYDSNGNGFRDVGERTIKNASVEITYFEYGQEKTLTLLTDQLQGGDWVWKATVFLGQVSIAVDGESIKSPYQGLLGLLGSGNYATTTNNETQTITYDGVTGISPFEAVGYKNSFRFSFPTGTDDVGRGGTDDTIFGGPGDDTIDAGAGDDHVVGGHWMTATDTNVPVNNGSYDAVVRATLDPGNPDNNNPSSPPLHNIYDQGPIFSIDTSGLNLNGSVSGQIWIDANNDGVQQNAELFLMMPVVVNLYDGEGNWVNSLITLNGQYTFSNIYVAAAPSTYVIQFELPNGYTFVTSPGGAPEARDNDAIFGGRTDKFMISSGAPAATNIDAGVKPSDLMPAPGTGSFEFEEPSYTVNENEGFVTVTIVRNNSSAVRSVVVRTRDGSAVAGVNYEAVTALLTFQIGEVFKTLDIPIIDANAINDLCTTINFTLELRDPTGRPLDENTVYIFGEGAGNITDDDTIQGGDDWDIILGDSGNIPAGAVISAAYPAVPPNPPTLGSLVFYGGPGKDIIRGGGGPDYIDAQLGNDWIAGNEGRDVIHAGLGDDVIVVERSDDVMVGEDVDGGLLGRDVVISDRDAARIALTSTGATTATLRHYDSSGLNFSLFNLYSIETARLLGGYQNNLFDIRGWNGSAVIVGRQGNDTLLATNDTDMTIVDPTLAEQFLYLHTYGFAKTGAVSLTSGSTYHLASIENVTLVGGASANKLDASSYSKPVTLIGLGGDDELIGGSAADTFVFDADDLLGTDTVKGNGGRDTLYFGKIVIGGVTYETLTGLILNLSTLAPANALVVPGNLTLKLADKIENVVGGSGHDNITGNDLDNVLTGGPGNDTLAGGLGNETYVFDTDSMWGTETISENILDAGYDIIDFSGTTTQQINLNLSILGGTQVVNANLSLRVLGEGFEEVIGGALDDTIRGNSNDNVLRGGAGNDLLDGKSGDDLLDGGAGNDDLNGGEGLADTIDETANTSFILTDGSLVRGNGEVDTLDNIEIAHLTGGSSANLFTISGWTGSGSLTGGGNFDTVIAAVDADFVLTDGGLTITRPSGVSTFLLGSIEGAILTGGEGDNVIDTAGFTGTTVLSGGNGSDFFFVGAGSDLIVGGPGIDSYIRDLSTEAVNAALVLQSLAINITHDPSGPNPQAELDTLNGIESVSVIGTPLGDTFDLSGWMTGSLTIDGQAGSDVIQAGGSGLITLTNAMLTLPGAAGPIAINGVEAAILIGSAQDDVLDATAFGGIVWLQGGAGSDVLRAGRNGGILDGGEGNDTLRFQQLAGLDAFFVIGGDGEDTLDFSSFTSGVTVDLSVVAMTQTVLAGDLQIRLMNLDVEHVIGGSGADTLNGNSLNNRITGNAGNDMINGAAGSDTLVESRDANFTLTNASLSVGAEMDALAGIEAAELTGGAGNNTLDASTFTGRVVLSGGEGNDTLRGGTQADLLIGGGGNDTLAGGNGGDTYRFDADLLLGDDTVTELAAGGSDILDFGETESVSLTVNLSLNSTQTVAAGRLRLTLTNLDTVDHIIGGAQADTLTGNGLDNFFLGNRGNDVLDGRLGNDVVFENFDADYTLTNSSLTVQFTDPSGPVTETDTLTSIEGGFLVAGDSDNTLDASAFTLGPVVLSGGDGHDHLIGGSGNDSLNGGNGNDLIEGGAGDDNLGGDDGNDELYGGVGDDTLNGDDGNDTLHGGGYDPTLMGLTDDDQLTGGRGNDTYVFDRSLQLGSDTVTELATPLAGFHDVILGLGLAGIDIDLFDTMEQQFAGETVAITLRLTLTNAGTVEGAF